MTGAHRAPHRRGHVPAAAPVAAVLVLAGVIVAVLWAGGQLPGTRPPGSAAPSASSSSAGPPSAGALLRSAAAALRGAGSAHVTGTVGGPAGPVRLDLTVTGDGRAAGLVQVAGVSADVVRTPQRTYVRSAALVRRVAGGLAATLVGDRWLAVGAHSLAGTGIDRVLATVAGLGSIADVVSAASAVPGATVHRAVAGGVAVDRVNAGPTTVTVRAAHPPYPVGIQAPGGVSLALDRFGAPAHIAAPTHGVIDIGKLPGIG